MYEDPWYEVLVGFCGKYELIPIGRREKDGTVEVLLEGIDEELRTEGVNNLEQYLTTRRPGIKITKTNKKKAGDWKTTQSFIIEYWLDRYELFIKQMPTEEEMDEAMDNPKPLSAEMKMEIEKHLRELFSKE